MYDGYNRIFWGGLITLFNINIGSINLLPNFVGYFVVANGLNVLHKESEFDGFQKIKVIGYLMAVLSFVGGIINFINQENTYFFLNTIWIIGFIIIDFMFFFNIIEKSIKYLELNDFDNTVYIYINKLRNYTILNLLNILFLGISLILNLKFYFTILNITLLFIYIYLTNIIYKLRNIFTEPELDEDI